MAKTSKIFLSFLLINLSSFVNLCLCDGTNMSDLDQLLPGLGQSAVLQNAQCMQKLLPCQPYLNSPNIPPPACCTPLKEMATTGSDCLCSVLSNPKLFVSLEVTKEQLLKLPKACGVDVDASKCNATTTAAEGTTPATSASSTSTSTSEDEAAAEEGSEATTSATKMITPYGITYFGVSGFVTLLTALVFSAY
ncbi:non-specific lipid transfer protein GPI-anchored 9-like isoform X1 [Vicia villosa]|uniref:non-specific lipid transfer protein GPI-anchored 9-like isoform X1 n=1 Tax=Vicia villosa TaxID=3911 RepID=UPI00273BEA45|nr:non-specific lipid transfer protein GPI-anchored 9-like isoform X1 [Vicia villosa]